MAAFWVAPVRAQQPSSRNEQQHEQQVRRKLNESYEKYKEVLTALGALIGLIGTGVPALIKTVESISLKSRRKQELDRIHDLTDLMKKIKEEDVLSKSTFEAVYAEIDAEIQTALAGLARNRQHRQMVLDRKKEQQHPDLTLLRSFFLLFRPHGIWAWVAHSLAYLSLYVALYGVGVVVWIVVQPQPEVQFHQDSFRYIVQLSGSIFYLFLFLLCRRWALQLRSRWQKAHPDLSAISTA